MHSTQSSQARFQLRLAAALIVWCAALCVGAPFPEQLWLQHSPIVFALLGLGLAARRGWLSNASFAAATLFMALHGLGARSIYSYVPYDTWAMLCFGRDVTTTFGFERNHYDRVVHFAFGVLVAPAVAELLERAVPLSRRWSSVMAWATITALAGLYELGEWIVALICAPERAERYLGQQGDPWDAHRDMALAVVGAALVMAWRALTSRARAS